MSCLIEKNNYFCTRFEWEWPLGRSIKKEEYVPRHIELTAVLSRFNKRDETNKKRVRELKDLN